MSREKQSGRRAPRKRALRAKNRRRRSTPERNKEPLAGAFHWLLPDASIFSKIKLHGNMAMAVAELFALKEHLAKRAEKSRAADPAARSLANTMRAIKCDFNTRKQGWRKQIGDVGPCLAARSILAGAAGEYQISCFTPKFRKTVLC